MWLSITSVCFHLWAMNNSKLWPIKGKSIKVLYIKCQYTTKFLRRYRTMTIISVLMIDYPYDYVKLHAVQIEVDESDCWLTLNFRDVSRRHSSIAHAVTVGNNDHRSNRPPVRTAGPAGRASGSLSPGVWIAAD